MAPHADAERTTSQVAQVYETLLASNHPAKSIGMLGESAGGGLIAATMLRLRAEHVALPGAVVLFSPWADLTETGDTYITLLCADPSLTADGLAKSAAAYAHGADLRSAFYSPIFGHYDATFPPTLIQASTRELLLSDSVRLYQAMSQAGAPAVLDILEGMPHAAAVAMAGTPEGAAAIKTAATLLRAHLA